MKIAIASKDAFLSYRAGWCQNAIGRHRVVLPDDFAPKLKVQEALYLRDKFGTGIPVECAVPSDVCKRNLQLVRCRVHGRRVKDKSYFHLSNNTYLSSPELCVLQMARDVDPIELVMAISEMCGGYSLPPAWKSKYFERRPLSSLGEMGKFLEESKGSAGARAMARALQLAVEDSNSPMETVLALILVLPEEYGGHGLPKPLMNAAACGFEGEAPVSFVRTGSPIKDVVYGDLVYPIQKVVVEYLSKEHHEGKWSQDAVRSNRLQASGFKVISVTPQQLLNPDTMRESARAIAEQLGCSTPVETDEWTLRNTSLVKRLVQGIQ